MARYKVLFAAKSRDVGKIVEMSEKAAAELVKFGRLERVPDAPKPAPKPKPVEPKDG